MAWDSYNGQLKWEKKIRIWKKKEIDKKKAKKMAKKQKNKTKIGTKKGKTWENNIKQNNQKIRRKT